MRFFWVRHGPTHYKGLVGWSDLPADLSDTDQVGRLSHYLPSDALVISSDLVRSVTTADAIAGTRQRLPHDPDLREMNFGEWELKRSPEVSQTHPELSRAFWSEPGHHAAPGGESWFDMTARTGRAVDRLMQAHRGRDVVVVAHFGVILARVADHTGKLPKQVLGQKIDNLSVTELTFDGTGWEVGAINHCP
ncbi:phosphoglycerate mutase [Oceanicola sp. 22II-s10i]|uniref:histidine phosphatase family protein n=1 Tax=Oceanicola sp. 22II-s10i TaxID=1317116 RepID=UPI000B62AD60|nr:phosphoglycerate mutase [Oceanicola sp. 22II-s10i]